MPKAGQDSIHRSSPERNRAVTRAGDSVTASRARGLGGEDFHNITSHSGVPSASRNSPIQSPDAEWNSEAPGDRSRILLHQTPQDAFIPGPLNSPKKTVYFVKAVWQWQMSEWLWISFDLSVADLLESLWNIQRNVSSEPVARGASGQSDITAGEDRPHKVFICVSPWTYVVDVKRMIQQNVSTRGVRPIRRCASGAYLWYIQKSGEKYIRLDPEVETRLETAWQAVAPSGAVPCQTRQRGTYVTWYMDGVMHCTDVGAMEDWTSGDWRRKVIRLELAVDKARSAVSVEKVEVVLPSLIEGKEECGTATCIGYSRPVDDDLCADLLLGAGIESTPDDICPICLESISPIVSSHWVKNRSQSLEEREKLTLASVASAGEGSSCSFRPCPLSYGGKGNVDSVEDNASGQGETGEHDGTKTPTTTVANANEDEEQDRSEAEKPVVKLAVCGHLFHRECICLYLHYTDRGGVFCPTCNALQAPGNGPSPPGVMEWQIKRQSLLEGHENDGTIIIRYKIEGGTQSRRHPSPSHPFFGTRRTAYLPATKKGRQMLQLLISAFTKGHTFTVGTSATSGASNVVVWNGIHHKTSVRGGVLSHGYPDGTYLDRLESELKIRGFVVAQSCDEECDKEC